jgi:cytoskeletal protein CcmA (bactofilin family)
MALFTQQTRKDDPFVKPEGRAEPAAEPEPFAAPVHPAAPIPLRSVERPVPASPSPTARVSESIVAAGLTIEGKIEGTGNVRVAGRFKGNVSVKGEVTIEPGASIDGEVKAETVFVAGEVRGQIVSSSLIEFKESGTLVGDLKAGSLTVVAGSKMRGRVEFGWKEGELDSTDGSLDSR